MAVSIDTRDGEMGALWAMESEHVGHAHVPAEPRTRRKAPAPVWVEGVRL